MGMGYCALVVRLKSSTASYYVVKPMNFLWYNHHVLFKIMNRNIFFSEVKKSHILHSSLVNKFVF